MSRSRFEASIDKRNNVESMERQGKISDSGEVRLALINRCMSGEITPEQMKAELAEIKRKGKKAGLLTRQQAWAKG